MNWKSRITVVLAALLAFTFASCTVEEAPPLVQTGSIRVTLRDPSGYPVIGAQLFLDGAAQATGSFPMTLQASVGSHWIRAEKDGFEPDSQEVNVMADSTVEATLILIPQDVGFVYIHAVDAMSGDPLEGGAIFIDGIPTSYTVPDTLGNVSAGLHTFGIGTPGRDFHQDEILVPAGEIIDLSLSLSAVPWNGIFVSSSADSALICVDEQFYGGWTDTTIVELAEGNHIFSCYRSGFATESPNLLEAYQLSIGGEPISYSLNFSLVEWSAGTGYNEGQLAPGFTLAADDNDTVSLGALRGRVVLVTFWYRDCVPCIQEMPYIEQVYEELGSQGFRVLAVNSMINDNLQDLIEVRANLGLTYEMLMDQPNHSTTLAYGGLSHPFPINCLVDQSGVVDWYTGSIEYAELRARVEQLLSQ